MHWMIRRRLMHSVHGLYLAHSTLSPTWSALAQDSRDMRFNGLPCMPLSADARLMLRRAM